MQDVTSVTDLVRQHSPITTRITEAVRRRIVGQDYMVERLLIGLLANGHILVEGVPGLAKTLAVRSVADAINSQFQRIQFTPDLLPADVIGTLIYNPRDGGFSVKKGPIFANIILADEINRAPAKVQSALLEAMQERQVTIGDTTHTLEEPFMVMATQNPIEQEGTYPLPEAQVDRFMLKLNVTYPSRTEEREILERVVVGEDTPLEPAVEPEQILQARRVVHEIYVDDKIKEYILDIVFATREPERFDLNIKHLIEYGASPRASIYLQHAARAHAFLKGRGFVTPQDVKSIGADVLRHRIIVSYEAEAEEITSEQIIQEIFNKIPVP